MFTVCGPEKEGCVGNQTLKDKSCLVPCTGLYADVEDNSLNFKLQTMQSNMMTGRILVLSIEPHISGFHMLTQELSNGVFFREDESKGRLQQMFPASTKEEKYGVKSFMESYHKYKREYVKSLSFNPEEDNLSKCI